MIGSVMKQIFLLLILLPVCVLAENNKAEHVSSEEGGTITQPAEVDLGVASFEDAVLIPAAGWGTMTYDPPVPGTYQLPPFGKAADGEVLNEEGEAKMLSDYYGDKYVILSFIFTTCADLNGCPLVTAVFYKLKQQLKEEHPELADQLRLISLSFDPEYDTPEVMKFYGLGSKDMGGSEWVFLTTESVEKLAPITGGFGQYVNQEYDEEGNPTGSYAHILRVFLIDKEGNKRAQYSAGFLHADSLISDVKTLHMEDTSH
jgi:cytochrome c peroxidase